MLLDGKFCASFLSIGIVICLVTTFRLSPQGKPDSQLGVSWSINSHPISQFINLKFHTFRNVSLPRLS